MVVKWKFRDGKWRRINVEFEEQYQKTADLTSVIRAIYDSDVKLTPQEQQEAIKALPGFTRDEMIQITKIHRSNSSHELAQTIRDIISNHRAPE